MMTVGTALGPGRAVARTQDGRAVVLHQDRLPFEHDQELVLAVVPVPL